jgi:glutathione S-transferase
MSEASRALTLYTDAFWISPYVFSAFVTLKEKGLAVTPKPVALQKKEQHDPAYRDRTITGRVPALEHGDFWLAESQAIIEYLDDAFPGSPRALPDDTRARARARQILGWIRSDLLALREERPTSTMFYDRADKPLTEAGQEAAKRLLHVADRLIPPSATSLFGAWSQADSDLSFMLHRLILNGHDVPAKIRSFAEAQWARPSVQAFVTHDRPAYVPY